MSSVLNQIQLEIEKHAKEIGYFEKVTKNVAKILKRSVRQGEVSYDGCRGYYVVGQDDSRGWLRKLGLAENYAIGEIVPGVALTSKGVDLGQRLLKESDEILR